MAENTRIKIFLTPHCLLCPEIDIEENFDRFYNGDSNHPYIVFGYLGCSKRKVCKHFKWEDTIQEKFLNKDKNIEGHCYGKCYT